MTQAYTKAAKRRNKKVGLPSLTGVPRKRTDGRKVRPTTRAEREPSRDVLCRRCMKVGLEVNTQNLALAKSVFFETEAGQVIFLTHKDDLRKVSDLYSFLCDIRKREGRYLAYCMAGKVHPNKDSVPHLPEPTETRDDLDYDFRDEEEIAEAAKRGYAQFCSDVKGCLNDAQARILWAGTWDLQGETFLREHKPTFKGAAFVQSLNALHLAVNSY